MNPALLGVLAAGGVILATEDTDAPVVRVPTPKAGTVRYAADIRRQTTIGARVTPLVTAPKATTASGMDAESESAIRARLEKEYNALSGEAKRAACERLKDQFPDDSNVQALNCANADFQQVLNVVGAAVGTALCGPACGALGVLAAQYFGEDINEMWNDISGAFSGDGDVCTGTRLYLPGGKDFASDRACTAWRTTHGDDWLHQWVNATDAAKASWNAAHK